MGFRVVMLTLGSAHRTYTGNPPLTASPFDRVSVSASLSMLWVGVMSVLDIFLLSLLLCITLNGCSFSSAGASSLSTAIKPQLPVGVTGSGSLFGSISENVNSFTGFGATSAILVILMTDVELMSSPVLRLFSLI